MAGDINTDEGCREVYGVSLEELKDGLRKGKYLDDIVKKLREGDLVHIYNPYDRHGPYLDQEGEIAWADPANDKYDVGVEPIEDYEWEFDSDEEEGDLDEDGYFHLDTLFDIEEIELLERDAGGYIDEMKKASWWPEVAEERASALAAQGRREAGGGVEEDQGSTESPF